MKMNKKINNKLIHLVNLMRDLLLQNFGNVAVIRCQG